MMVWPAAGGMTWPKMETAESAVDGIPTGAHLSRCTRVSEHISCAIMLYLCNALLSRCLTHGLTFCCSQAS